MISHLLSSMQSSKVPHPDLQLPRSCLTDMAPPLSVLDLPVAFLVQVSRKLDHTSRLSLFSTSKACMELVVDSTDITGLRLQPMEVQQQQMLTALGLAQHHVKSVSLCMGSWQQQGEQVPYPNEAWAQHARQLAERSCTFLHHARLLGYLEYVTSIKLVGAMLAMPLMPVFSESCPNLTALALHDSNITWEGVTADSFSATFPKLQSLHLHNVVGQLPTVACQHGLQQQLAQLTGLKSMHLQQHDEARLCNVCLPLYDAITAALTPTIVSQLVQFEVPSSPQACQWEFNQFKSLQVLQLDCTRLGDKLMQQLLPLPNLTSVSVSDIQLEQSYSGHTCHWQHLVIRDMALSSFARLPFHSNLQIKGFPTRPVTIYARLARMHIQETLDNIRINTWSGWKGAHLIWLKSYSPEHQQLVHEGLPLCHGAGRLKLPRFALSKSDMMTMGEFATVQQKGFVLDLSCRCTWDVADLAGLVCRLPVGGSLVVSGIEEATIIQLCSAAKRSFALHAKRICSLLAGAKERVEAGLLQRGCMEAVVHDTYAYDQRQMGLVWDWIVVVNSGRDAEPVAQHRHSMSWAAALRATKEWL